MVVPVHIPPAFPKMYTTLWLGLHLSFVLRQFVEFVTLSDERGDLKYSEPIFWLYPVPSSSISHVSSRTVRMQLWSARPSCTPYCVDAAVCQIRGETSTSAPQVLSTP